MVIWIRHCCAFLGALLVLALASAQSVSAAQATASLGDIESSFDGRQVSITFHEDRGRQGTISASLDMIDFDATTLNPDSNGHAILTINCRNGAKCFDGDVTVVGGANSGDSAMDYQYVLCSSLSQCQRFLDALKQAAADRKGSGRPSAVSRTQNEPTRQAKPQPEQTKQAAAQPPARPLVPERVPGPDGFRDVLDGIGWKKGNGTDALDDLLKQTRPTPNRRPPSEQPTFAAFAQSAGFDANGAFGFATAGNLNDAIGRANSSCASYAQTSCGDEGYCMLRPGLWGAWASDQKYLGNKAFACNLRTEEEAIDQALAWCGFGCKVLWKGSAQ